MTLSLEGLPLLIIFLLPGFFVFHTRRYLNPVINHKLDNFELGLLSLGYGTVISVFEALVVSYTLSRLGVDIAGLIANPVAIVKNNPVLTIASIFVWIIVGIALALLLGILDPYYILLQLKNKRSRQIETDIWHNVLEVERAKQGKNTEVTATVHMKNGELYFGAVHQFENISDDSGHRNFVLYKVTFVKGNNSNPSSTTSYLGDHSFVILSTRDIDSLDLLNWQLKAILAHTYSSLIVSLFTVRDTLVSEPYKSNSSARKINPISSTLTIDDTSLHLSKIGFQ